MTFSLVSVVQYSSGEQRRRSPPITPHTYIAHLREYTPPSPEDDVVFLVTEFAVCFQLGREVELDDDLRQLTFYSVQSGDTIYLRW